MSVPFLHTWGLHQEDIRSSGARVKDGVSRCAGTRNQTQILWISEQPVFLTTEPSLQPQSDSLYCEYGEYFPVPLSASVCKIEQSEYPEKDGFLHFCVYMKSQRGVCVCMFCIFNQSQYKTQCGIELR